MILYEVDPIEMTCTCHHGRFNGHKSLCRHVRQVINGGMFYSSPDGKQKFHVWKEEGKARWFGANPERGFVGDSLKTVLNAIGSL
mgnify:CR=1 FL=1|jgi:hypothetical protein|tara:strand:- start:142 stop:396 length:255 start_codon:yes stop_codon:yes gene_type:complete